MKIQMFAGHNNTTGSSKDLRWSLSQNQILLIILLGIALLSSPLSILAQDKTNLGKIVIPEENAQWKVNKKSALAFQPLEMKDKSGKALDPNAQITLKSGKKVTNKQFFDELNGAEKNLRKNGYTLKGEDKSKPVKYAVPKNQAALNLQKTLVPSEGTLLSNDARLTRQNAEKKVGNLVAKPVKAYSAQEFKDVRKNSIVVQGANLSAATTQTGSNPAPGTLLKNINHSKSKTWKFGDKDIFQTEFNATASLKAKYYQPAGKEEDMTQDQITEAIRATKTEFQFATTAKANGFVFGKAFTIADVKGDAYLPADKTKKAKVIASAKFAGISILNLSKEFSTEFNETGNKSKEHRWGREVNFSIAGVPMSAEVGVSGKIGFEYALKGSIPFYLIGSCKPYATLSGYAEAAVDAVVFEAGVSGRLNFVKGYVDVDGSAGLLVWNNVLLWANINAGYNLEFLGGSLSVYLETPDVCPFVDCSVRYDWDIWDFDGYKRSGNFVDEYNLHVFNW